jgi:hypothetical protein
MKDKDEMPLTRFEGCAQIHQQSELRIMQRAGSIDRARKNTDEPA